VVISAMRNLCELFCDILPSYRIREQKVNVNEDADKAKKVSKDVQVLRERESTMLETYKEYLKVLEIFSKTHPEKLIK
jgi:hypothetical protein